MGTSLFFRRSFMSKKLYIGNLALSASETDVRGLFEPHGAVDSVQVIMDREACRSKGFGFVEMRNDPEAQAAIAALNGQAMNGRALTVNEARLEPRGSESIGMQF